MSELTKIIDQLKGWSRVAGDREAVTKRFKFEDFNAAWIFMSACALKAEQLDHHPEWSNVYATVDVVLTTHDMGGVTDKDRQLAEFMDKVASKIENG